MPPEDSGARTTPQCKKNGTYFGGAGYRTKRKIKKGTENKSVPKVRNEKKLKPYGQPKN